MAFFIEGQVIVQLNRFYRRLTFQT